MLEAFATLDQLAARIPGGIADEDEARAQAALEDASARIRSEAGKTWTDEDGDLDLPTGEDAWRADILVSVCVAVALRAFTNPEQVVSEGIGTYRVQRAADVYLTRAERQMIHRAAGATGLWALAIGQDTPPVEYLDVEPAGEPIPWVGPDGY